MRFEGRPPRRRVNEANKSTGEKAEELRSGREIGGKPLAQAELDENEETPGKHQRKELDAFAIKKLAGNQRNDCEGECEKLRKRQQPKCASQTRDSRQESGPEFIVKPWWDSIDNFPNSRESPND